jgi:hypothetical protein
MAQFGEVARVGIGHIMAQWDVNHDSSDISVCDRFENGYATVNGSRICTDEMEQCRNV